MEYMSALTDSPLYFVILGIVLVGLIVLLLKMRQRGR
jgi:LPXTG-motif cell wall-anchored protein